MNPSFTVIGDLYNCLFSAQISNPEVLVNYQVWNQIKANLPKGYKLPDPVIVDILNQHASRM
ncbi:hypothetical protein NV379_21250 [Paenibacillus sp. N1-5-1-14]|uniref:hypothetical protein n=1 Tax=Paenibacillus radicibacter TaxID=2972488 RepID=UPI00215992DE|nr:hypothetical protein [Paenibacillus radicibacter]MCR8645185.1 hypothetical protein [Paenibacillus radicibacter]